jgi:phosphatidylserine/phosphatidylglycerophosphate/cardiolipin synthase-like enzyme
VPFYSPRIADNMLDWYGQRIIDACSLAMITLPFNVARQILDGLDQAKRALRLVILESEPDRVVLAAEKRNAGRLAFSNGAILGKSFVHNKAGGAKVAPISQGHLDDWFIAEELARPVNKGHVFFLHSKILLIDPLSDDPLVCTGSANFSSNSLISNDENMLLIRGNMRIADIYLTELDRIFKHFFDRDAINRSAAAGAARDVIHLDTTRDWIDRNFRAGSYKNNRLLTFFPDAAGPCAWSENAAADPDPFADEQGRAAAKRAARNAAARARRAADAEADDPA